MPNNQEPFSNLNRLWAYLIIKTLKNLGTEYFFPSPGMRNAPFLWALGKHEGKVTAGRDERSQGFMALGSSKVTGQASALFCTSGSALSHYLPAIMEADKTDLPLIVISSDRPTELIQYNANQTVQQENIYKNFCRESLNLPCPSEDISPRRLEGLIQSLINKAWHRSTQRGPVHINIRFREPLGFERQDISKPYLEEAFEIIGEAPQKTFSWKQKVRDIPSQAIVEKIWDRLLRAEKPLLVIGELPPWQEYPYLRQFLDKIDIPHYIDITSGLKFLNNQSEGQTPTFDHPEVLKTFEKTPPDFILHLGGRTTSKYYEYFIEKHSKTTLYHVDQAFHPVNPGGAVNENFNLIPEKLVKEFLQKGPLPKTNYQWFWSSLVEKKSALIDNAPLCYPSLSKLSIENLKPQTSLFIGNSTFIRSFNSYASNSLKKDLHIFCNRGVSGIEGNLSTALGVQLALKKPLILFIGDISLYHDLNALQVLSEHQLPLLIVVAVNKMGGIFNLLPVAKDPEGEKYLSLLTTPLEIDWNSLSQSFSLKSQEVRTPQEYLQCLKEWQKNPQPLVLATMFSDQENQQMYQKLQTIRL